jgi:hypothetical protein
MWLEVNEIHLVWVSQANQGDVKGNQSTCRLNPKTLTWPFGHEGKRVEEILLKSLFSLYSLQRNIRQDY